MISKIHIVIGNQINKNNRLCVDILWSPNVGFWLYYLDFSIKLSFFLLKILYIYLKKTLHCKRCISNLGQKERVYNSIRKAIITKEK